MKSMATGVEEGLLNIFIDLVILRSSFIQNMTSMVCN